MRCLVFIATLVVLLGACKKEKTYLHFSDKQLDFINYTEGQILKFIDTAGSIQTLVQGKYQREFREQIGITGKTGTLREEYEVLFNATGTGNLSLYVNADAHDFYPVQLQFAGYYAMVQPDSLDYTFTSVTINGVPYSNVYTVKTYWNGQYINNTDTATLFHNRQYGVIQLLFPNGKRIARVD